ncbi:MATE family efflux transporter [Blautia stercoris]
MDGNLTKGPILKTLTKLALPIMASSFLGTLYNITDMAWIGLLGSKAVAGVGVGGMFTWLSQGLASMARMGGQVKVAQSLGRGEKEKAHGFAQTAVQLSTFMGLAYAILCLIFVRQMVGFFKLNDPEAVSAALSYTKIACGLIVFSFLTVTLTGIYTAQGDSK